MSTERVRFPSVYELQVKIVNCANPPNRANMAPNFSIVRFSLSVAFRLAQYGSMLESKREGVSFHSRLVQMQCATATQETSRVRHLVENYTT